ncbi:MAG: single-stranded-DNA-specific exonuclease RecJ [Armatimonadetes bacterium]|nr:single-stranded-DNA-specific exonuclease RecJ [Armatimonadota bacterium]
MITTVNPAHWVAPGRNASEEARLSSELGITPLLASVLNARGMTDAAFIREFLNPNLDSLHKPQLLPDYELAKAEILRARDTKELIFVHGDYDVDGITSASILDRFLKNIGCNVYAHVPHRMKEGYGVHHSAVQRAADMGAKLFITCDCGTGAIEQVKMAHELGMRVVVTDHHSIGDTLPEAEAVINPHREDSRYPFNELSGAGVVFKLCAGLAEDLGMPVDKYYHHFLDLAALGTIADVMPLIDENRIIAKHGLNRLSSTQKAGLLALKEVAECPDVINVYQVGFVLAPRLNATGRIDDAAIALQLLRSKDIEEARKLAKVIDSHNTSRRESQELMIESAKQQVLDTGQHEKNVIVVHGEGWHPGIVGIVAGRLVETFYRPTFVFSTDAALGVAKGSARSIEKFNLADSINKFRPLLISGGGHAMAAGCSLPMAVIDEFRAGLDEYAGSFLKPEDFYLTRQADAEVSLDELTLDAVAELELLSPTGPSNPGPSFFSGPLDVVGIKRTRKPSIVHLSVREQSGRMMKAVTFTAGESIEESIVGTRLQLFFEPTINEFNGRTNVELRIKDMRPA